MDQNSLRSPRNIRRTCQTFRSCCCCAVSALTESTELWLTMSLTPWARSKTVSIGKMQLNIHLYISIKPWMPTFSCISAQICTAPYDQLWCNLWAEHTFLSHCLHPEPRVWSYQWPHETSREVWLWWQQVQVPCHGPRPREGTKDFFSISEPQSFKGGQVKRIQGSHKQAC